MPSPRAPTVSPPPSEAAYTLSGTVYEHLADGMRPLRGMPLEVWELVGGTGRRTVTSDAEGRYRVPFLPGRGIRVTAVSDDFLYLQPCPSTTVLTGDTTMDVHLVAARTTRGASLPSTFPVVEPTLSGRVVERTPEGLRPVADAFLELDFSGGEGWEPGAQSISDGSGQYLFCQVTHGGMFGVGIWVVKTGYRSAYFHIGSTPVTSTRDLELVRL